MLSVESNQVISESCCRRSLPSPTSLPVMKNKNRSERGSIVETNLAEQGGVAIGMDWIACLARCSSILEPKAPRSGLPSRI